MTHGEKPTHNRPKQSSVVAERVFREIKARVIACEFEQGRPIRLNPLARKLGVSTTPVREALNMLAANGLVLNEPHKGFIAMSLSEDRLIGLYRLNQILLNTALIECALKAELPATTAGAVAGIGNELDQGERHSPEAIAAYTAKLFSHIAALANHSNVMESVDRVNDSLFYIRTIECRYLDDVPLELIYICELLLAERCDELSEVIADYHSNRVMSLTGLMEFLRR